MHQWDKSYTLLKFCKSTTVVHSPFPIENYPFKYNRKPNGYSALVQNALWSKYDSGFPVNQVTSQAKNKSIFYESYPLLYYSIFFRWLYKEKYEATFSIKQSFYDKDISIRETGRTLAFVKKVKCIQIITRIQI